MRAALAIALTACGTYGFTQGFDGPICIGISAELPEEVQALAVQSIDAWKPHPIRIDVEVGGRCSNQIAVNESYDYRKGQVAVAEKTLKWDGTRGDSDIWLHPRFLDLKPCLQLEILIHEFGHILGLEHHSSNPDDVMRSKINECKNSEVTPEARHRVENVYR